MKKWGVGIAIAIAALLSVSASAGIFDLFKTLLQTTETILIAHDLEHVIQG
jgi:F420-0:gamma-glutamyl ligase